MDAREVLAALEGLPRVDVAGPALLSRLQELEQAGTLDMSAYVQVQEEVERALAELGAHVDQVRKVVERCGRLCAMPGREAPLGF